MGLTSAGRELCRGPIGPHRAAGVIEQVDGAPQPLPRVHPATRASEPLAVGEEGARLPPWQVCDRIPGERGLERLAGISRADETAAVPDGGGDGREVLRDGSFDLPGDRVRHRALGAHVRLDHIDGGGSPEDRRAERLRGAGRLEMAQRRGHVAGAQGGQTERVLDVSWMPQVDLCPALLGGSGQPAALG